MLPSFEAYLLLLIDSFRAALLVPVDSELVFPVLLAFGGYSPLLSVGIALAAGMAGYSVNYAVGRAVNRGVSSSKNHSHLWDKILGVEKYANRFSVLLVFLAYWDFFSSISTLFAGLFKVRLASFLLFTLIGRVFHYLYFVYG